MIKAYKTLYNLFIIQCFDFHLLVRLITLIKLTLIRLITLIKTNNVNKVNSNVHLIFYKELGCLLIYNVYSLFTIQKILFFSGL